jgi:hypothetical protein
MDDHDPSSKEDTFEAQGTNDHQEYLIKAEGADYHPEATAKAQAAIGASVPDLTVLTTVPTVENRPGSFDMWAGDSPLSSLGSGPPSPY